MNLLEILKKNADNAKSYIDGLVSKKQDTLTFDTAPTEGSQNPVTSDGIQKAIAAKTVDLSNYPTKDGTGASGNWNINAATATKAIQDGAGNVIADTYVPKKEIKVSTDLDTLKETGFYNFPLSSICTEANHFPLEIASAVLVIKNGANGDGCTQICFPYREEKFYKRTYLASTQKWHDWDTSAFMADLNLKQDKLVFDTAPTAGSTNPVTSGGVKAAIDSATPNIAAMTEAEVDECVTAAGLAVVDGDSKSY